MYQLNIQIRVDPRLSAQDTSMLLHTLSNEIEPALRDKENVPLHVVSEHPFGLYILASGEQFDLSEPEEEKVEEIEDIDSEPEPEEPEAEEEGTAVEPEPAPKRRGRTKKEDTEGEAIE